MPNQVEDNGATKDQFGVAVGEIRSDVKHLVTAMHESKHDMRDIRASFEKESASMRASFEKVHDKHDARLTKLEQHSWRIAGWVGLMGTLIPIAVTMTIAFFSKGL